MAAEESLVVNCDGQSLDIVGKWCRTRIKSGWNKFRELLPLLASRGLPLISKEKVFQACVHSVILYGSETWPVKEEDIKSLERNDARMIR